MLESAGLPITISGVTKTYGAVYALDSFDLAIQQGEFLTLLGRRGQCGLSAKTAQTAGG